MKDPFILEWINRIFLDYSPNYHSLKKLAKEDVSKKLQEEIKNFLEKREEKEHIAVEHHKTIFEDPSNVSDENINSIVDAFIRMRSEQTLDEIELKSINDILILFNRWVNISNPEKIKVFDELSNIIVNKSNSIDDHLAFAKQTIPHLHYPINQSRERYSTINPDAYHALDGGEFIFGDKLMSSTYDTESRPIYKAMRPNL